LIQQFGQLPIQVGSSLYIITEDFFTDKNSHCFLSTDSGNVWSEQDSGDVPFAGKQSVAVYDGSRYIWVNARSTSGFVSMTPFDTHTNTWGTSIVSILADSSATQNCAYFRGVDGQVLIASLIASVGSALAQCCLFNTSTQTFIGWFACGDTVTPTINALGGCFGSTSSNLSYIIFVTLLATGPVVLGYQSVDGTGTVGTFITIDTDVSATTQQFAFQPYCDGNHVILGWPYDGSSGGSESVVSVYESIFSSLSFTRQILNLPSLRLNTPASATCLIVSGTFLFFVLILLSSGDVTLFQYSDSGSGFGSASALVTSANSWDSVQVQPASGLFGGYAIVVDAEPPVQFLAQPVIVTTAKIVSGFLGTVVLSVSSACLIGQPKRRKQFGPRPILVGDLTYPETYVR
jgi:hypothetical protein